ncbi:MAG: enoyl-CoA hydratase/carnithine racemase [Paraglaciecola psychrophila]|jgi:enoyl-CoA hydratase/carnithine racemase
MTFEAILYDVEDKILTITLNRPEQLNAFNGAMMYELFEAFDMADADDEVGAIIITGAGRGFCAGADLSAGSETWEGHEEALEGSTRGDGGGEVTRRIYECLKPVIVAFNGPAVGVGLTMTLSADIRLAAPNVKMGFVFSARGIIPEGCSSYFLPRLVGISKALEWCYSAKVFRSEEAQEAGLIRSIHPAEDLMTEARTIAKSFINGSSAVSNAVLRQMLWRMLGASDPIEAHRIDTAGINALGTSADAKEGITAFLEKREPNFPAKVSKDMPEFFPWWKKEQL